MSPGPSPDVNVLTTFRIPIIAVRSFGRIMAARKADRGATSIDWVQERRIRKVRARGIWEGIAMKATNTAEGR